MEGGSIAHALCIMANHGSPICGMLYEIRAGWHLWVRAHHELLHATGD